VNTHSTTLHALLLALLFGTSAAYSDGSAGPSGSELYHVYCSQCHGLEGDGFGVNSYDLDVAPRDHTDTDEMMARTDAELFKAIKFGGKSVNKSVLMPEWEGNLSDEEIHKLVAYLREVCCTETEQ
jgi:cytochrome c oxidase cbb3-type subunit 3